VILFVWKWRKQQLKSVLIRRHDRKRIEMLRVPEVPQVPDDAAPQPLTTLSKLEHKGELQAQHGAAEPLVEEEKFADALQAYEEFLQEAEDEQIEDEEEDDEASVTSSMSALSMNSSTSVPLEKVKTRLVEASAVLRALQNSNITAAGFNQVCQALMSDSTLKAQLFKKWVQLEDVPGTLATPLKKTEKKTLSSSEKQVLANEKKLKYVTNLEPFFDDSEMQVLQTCNIIYFFFFRTCWQTSSPKTLHTQLTISISTTGQISFDISNRPQQTST
jgi:hypothetical protein